MRYQIDVTEMGRRLQASLVDTSGLGIAVEIVSNKGVSTLPYTNFHNKEVTMGAKISLSINKRTAYTSNPKAPTEELAMPATVVLASSSSNSALR